MITYEVFEAAHLLSIPLPFVAGLLFVLVLHRALQGAEVPGSRRYFRVFLFAYALQGMIVGLRFGYGLDALAFVQPVTAAVMPPLAYLAFRALAASPMKPVWWHLAAPLSVVLAMVSLPLLVDPLLAVTFVVYGISLFRLTVSDPEAVAEAPLNRAVPALRAARLTAGLMIFFAVTDALVSLAASVYGRAAVPVAVGLLNLAAIAVVLVYYFLPEPQSSLAPVVAAVDDEPSPDDRLLVAKVAAALERDKLYGREDLSLARLARSAGHPPRDVSAAINRVTSLNVSQFVNNRRISEACRLLQETDKPLTTVMFDSGFGTKSNFNREFRRVTGTSPSQWRRGARDKSG